jgi:hypothetical protein
VGDLQRLDIEVNQWLGMWGDKGYDVLSRDQVSNEQGVSITYCMTKAGSDFLRAESFKKQTKVLELAFRYKERLTELVAAVEASGRAVTWENLVACLKGDEQTGEGFK